ELRPVERSEAPKGEPLDERAAREQHEQHDAHHEARDRVAEQHDERRDGIEARAGAHRLCDAERQRDEIDQEKRPHPEADRHRQLLEYQLPYVLVVKKAPAEIETGVLAEHVEKSLGCGPVEAVKLLDLLDAFRIDTLASPIASGGGTALGSAPASLELRHHLFDGPARDELGNDERDQEYPEQRRYHQQQPLDNVGPHCASAPIFSATRSTRSSLRAGNKAAPPPAARTFPSGRRPGTCCCNTGERRNSRGAAPGRARVAARSAPAASSPLPPDSRAHRLGDRA